MPWWSWEDIRKRRLPRNVAPPPVAPPELARKANTAPPATATGPGPHHPLLPLLAALASLVATAKEDEAMPGRRDLHDRRLKAIHDGDSAELLEIERAIVADDKRWQDVGTERRAAGRAVALWLDEQLESFGAPPRFRRWALMEIGSQVQYHVNEIQGE